MRPFTRANNQAAIEFNVREAVMEVVPSHPPVFIYLCIYLPHYVFGSHQASNLELGSGHCCIHQEFAISFVLTMPRDRGKPCHGPAWYTLAARQKWLQKLEWALSIARTQKARLARNDDRERMAWSPPTVFVEEVIPEEAIQLPPENFLFTGPEPPIILPGDEIRADTGVNNMASPVEDFPVCYIEEEISDEYLQMAQNDLLSEELAPLTVSEREPGSTGTGAEGGVEERSATTGHPRGRDGWNVGCNRGWTPGGRDGWVHVEGGWRGPHATSYSNTLRSVVCPSALLPPGPTRFGARFEAPDGRPGLPWCTHEPTHGHALWGSLDAPTKQRCPTCARLYALPARYEMPSDDPDNEDLNG
jgi:hypothetical protein